MTRSDSTIALVWENFGPTHIDRCEALATLSLGRTRVIGIEICGSSSTYEWVADKPISFVKQTLFPKKTVTQVRFRQRVSRILGACMKSGAGHVFLCHYQDTAIFCVAMFLRLIGRRVYVMNDSKFDDYPRSLWRELCKSAFYFPYQGALAGSERARDYMRFLGVRADGIESPYNAISLARINRPCDNDALGAVAFDDRHITIIARLVPKKNIATAIAAYALYCRGAIKPRSLHIYGSGTLEATLRAQVETERLAEHVHFHGFVQAEEIAAALHHSLAVLLPSIEEQFGFAALEALCAGVPVILSHNCGACDGLVRTGVNGFIVEPMNVDGLAFFLNLLVEDETLWLQISAEARRSAEAYDAKHFVAAVERLISRTS